LLWLLPKKSRIKLHNHWLQKAKEKAEEELHRLSERYKEVCDGLLQLDRKTCLKILREAKVVGMTTTGAAKNYDLLQALRAEIVVIEEAAEVLEAHVLPCIGSFTQHLILLGDHLQLRPSVAEYELATKYKLEISLFERLISGGIEHVTLRCQRRMRPSISRLISDIYPSLQDHCSVTKYENIKGIRNDVFFLDHKAMESQISDTNSKINIRKRGLLWNFVFIF
jgi:superfamily I DNA and/or RNA helicase